MSRILPLSEVQRRRLDEHRCKSVAATRAALQRLIANRRLIENEKRRDAYIATREAAIIAEQAHDRASVTRIACARKKVADCG